MRSAALASLALLLACGIREPGLEVAIDLEGAASGATGVLEIAATELLVCPDVDARTAWRELVGPGVAYAHDGPAIGTGATLTFPAPRTEIVVAVPPGSYCDVRIQLGSLTLASGRAPARDVVLRLVDDAGTPTRVTLARAPERVVVQIALGTFDASDSADHALSRIFAGAVARLRP